MSLHYLGKQESQKLGLFRYGQKRPAVACYILDTCQTILIIFLDNKIILLSTVCKQLFFFTWPNLLALDVEHVRLYHPSPSTTVTRLEPFQSCQYCIEECEITTIAAIALFPQ